MAPDRANKTDLSGGRKSTKHWLYAAVVVWAISFVMMAAFGTYAIIQGQRVNKRLCQVADNNRTTLVNILTFSKQQSLERSATPEERNLIRQTYDSLLALIPPLECTKPGGPEELGP